MLPLIENRKPRPLSSPALRGPGPVGFPDAHFTRSAPEKRTHALSLVRKGRLYDLGRELHEGVPVFPGRFFRQTLVTSAIVLTSPQ